MSCEPSLHSSFSFGAASCLIIVIESTQAIRATQFEMKAEEAANIAPQAQEHKEPRQAKLKAKFSCETSAQSGAASTLVQNQLQKKIITVA